MHINKTPRIFFISLLLIFWVLSLFTLSSVQADTSSSATLSPAITAKLDAFIAKVKAKRVSYSSDANWNIFIDALGSKIVVLKPKYAENPLILMVLDRLSLGIGKLKAQENAVVSPNPTAIVSTGSTAVTTPITSGPPYHCSGLYGTPEMEQYANDLQTRVDLQYRSNGIYTMEEIKQDTTKFRPGHAIEIDGVQIQTGTFPAVRCKGTKSNARTTPLSTSPYQGSKCIIKDIVWEARNAKGTATAPNPQHLLPSGSAFAFRYTPPLFPFFSSADTTYAMGYTYISLSENPCEFSAELEAKGCSISHGGKNQGIRYATSDYPGLSGMLAQSPTGLCIVDPGKTYYFNVRGSQTWNGPDSIGSNDNTFWFHY